VTTTDIPHSVHCGSFSLWVGILYSIHGDMTYLVPIITMNIVIGNNNLDCTEQKIHPDEESTNNLAVIGSYSIQLVSLNATFLIVMTLIM
jgi:hypothetical protein